jgi:hypothetical protein
MSMDKSEAMTALGTIEGAQAALARAADCPPSRHAAFGLLMGSIVMAQGLKPPLSLALLVLSGIGGLLIFQSDRRRMGMFINGYRKAATRPLTLLLLAAMLLMGWGEIAAHENGLSLATRIGIAAIAGVLAAVASVAWQRTFRREMGLDS